MTIDYLCTYFQVDIIAIIPFLINLFKRGNMNRMWLVMRFSRLSRIKRILQRLDEFASFGSDHYVNQQNLINNLNMAVKTCFIIGFLMHSLACLFAYIGLVHVLWANEHYDSWVSRFGLTESPPLEVYSTSLIYTAVTITTTGYGDIYALTNWEKVFACILIYIGMVTFSMIRQRIKMWRSQAKVSKVIFSIEEQTTDFFMTIAKLQPKDATSPAATPVVGGLRKPSVMDHLQTVVTYQI